MWERPNTGVPGVANIPYYLNIPSPILLRGTTGFVETSQGVLNHPMACQNPETTLIQRSTRR